MKTSKYSSLLGIALEGGRMTVVALRRAGERVEARQTLQAPLSLDLLTDDPALAGREIRNRLTAAGIRETRCVVCVPLKWALTARIETPAGLAEEDLRSYLTLQAEREFPFAPADLSLATSRYRTPGGTELATIVAIPSSHLSALLAVLKAARLRPVSVTLGATALLECGEPAAAEGTVNLLLGGENGADLAVAAGGGVVALRTLEEAVDSGQDEFAESKKVDAENIAKHIRITLGQTPADLRGAIRAIRVFGPAPQTAQLAAELSEPAARMGLTVTPGQLELSLGNARDGETLANLAPSALAAAASCLLKPALEFEFLPPRLNRLQALTRHIASRRTAWLAAAAVALALICGGAFGWQYWRLSAFERQWRQIQPAVAQVELLRDRVRKFRPWFDDTPQHLAVLSKLTQAFPEEGSVWAKTIGIASGAGVEVSCAGLARTRRDWLRVLDSLKEIKGVSELKTGQIRGESPLQFTLTYKWNGGPADGR